MHSGFGSGQVNECSRYAVKSFRVNKDIWVSISYFMGRGDVPPCVEKQKTRKMYGFCGNFTFYVVYGLEE